MELSIINIGNSKGIRLSKNILDKYHLKDKINLELKKDCIVIKPNNNPRKDWEESFKKMRKNGDDKLLIDDVFLDEKFD